MLKQTSLQNKNQKLSCVPLEPKVIMKRVDVGKATDVPHALFVRVSAGNDKVAEVLMSNQHTFVSRSARNMRTSDVEIR